MVDDDDQLLKSEDEPRYKLLKCCAVKSLSKLVDETVPIQRPKDTVLLPPFVLISDGRPAADREPAVCQVRCYREDALVQK